MKRYLVTGGLGVIGSAFAESLIHQGHTVEIMDACEEPRNQWMSEYFAKRYPGKVGVHKVRIERCSYLDVFMKPGSHTVDSILHAAAHTGIPHSVKDPTDDWASNVDATRSLLEAMRINKAQIPFVALSSVKPYRVHDLPVHVEGSRYEWDSLDGISETTVPLEPDEPYAASKMAQSALCMSYARSYDLPITVFRCSNLYGAAPSHGPRHGWLTWFCLSAIMNRPIEIQGTGLQVRDMLYSSDVTSAVLTAFDFMDECKGNVYNIGGGRANSTSVREAADSISSRYPVELGYAGGRKNEDPIFITDYTKFKNVTGWEPKVRLQDGIDLILDWAQANKEDLRRMYDGV